MLMMEERARLNPAFERRPILRGADDQTKALKELLARTQFADAEEDERNWQVVKGGLQETRRALGQRLLFPE
jgi:hypothetical protein